MFRAAATLVLIGHAGHPEVEGTIGQINAPVHLVGSADEVADLPLPVDEPIAYITQTTLSVDDTRSVIAALKARFTDVVGPETSDICYATQNRQSAVRELCRLVDLLLVVGSPNSSNSNRLREIGIEEGLPSYLVADGDALDPAWFMGVETVGLTARGVGTRGAGPERDRRAAPFRAGRRRAARRDRREIEFRLPPALNRLARARAAEAMKQEA